MEPFEQSFDLAYFLLGDEQDAGEAVACALVQLQAADRVQRRRGLYPARLRRNRISTERGQLLQRLILIACEPFERRAERDPARSSQEDLLVRYVKHLVRLAWKRSSLHALVGLCRLLYRFETAEMLDLFSLLHQDPSRLPEESYCRSRKARLMEELVERFGSLLEVVREGRGELRFVTCGDSASFGDLVAECLERLSPWSTPCLVPRDPAAGRAWRWPVRDSRGDGAAEVARFHSLLHPACLESLCASLALGSPRTKLAVPRFRAEVGGKGLEARSRELDDDGRRAILARLSEAERLRQQVDGRFLRVLVDGREQARFQGDRPARAVASLAEAERIEVKAEGEVPMALLLLGPGVRPRQAWQVRVAGARLLLRLADAGRLELRYRPSGGRARRVASRLSLSWPRLPDLAWAALATAISLALSLTWLDGRQAPTQTPEQAEASSPPALTREAHPLPEEMSLGQVRRIFVLSPALAEALGEGGRFSAADAPAEADAVLKGSLDGSEVLLVDRQGRVLWRLPLAEVPAAEPANRAARILSALAAAAAEAETRP